MDYQRNYEMSSTYLVTGAGGFIGSHLVEELTKQGAKVKALVRYNSKNNWGWLENSELKDQFEVVVGDVRDYDSVHKALENCQAVFHLAALIGIPYSYLSPLAYIKTNVEGTYNILQASLKLDVENVVLASTSEVYGSAQYVPIDEKHPLVGQSPYSASKIGADQLGLSYFRSFGLPVRIVRPFNTYGPRQSARAIIPSIASQILFGKKEVRIGNLDPTRDLTFVKDTANAFVEVSKSGELLGEVTNVGMNVEISVKDLWKLIDEICGGQSRVVQEEARIRPAKSEVDRLKCDNQKILSKTKWRPQYNLRKGLEETIQWIKAHQESYKSDIYNV